MNKYVAYGLVFESDLDLAPLKPFANDRPVDVRVRKAKVSDQGIENPVVSLPYAQIGDSEVWLDIPDICRLLISDGDQILVDPCVNADEQGVRLFVLGSAMGAILHQRGFLVLHANAIYVDDGAVLFAGTSGAGKSTTAAVLHQMGYQVLSDDVVAVDESGCIVGGFPQIKLWQDALDQLKISSEGLNRIRLQVQKYSFPLPSGIQDIRLPVKAIYFLEIGSKLDQNMLESVKLEGIEKFEYLNEHTYRRQFMAGLGLKPRHLGLCSKIAAHAHMVRLIRPPGRFSAAEIAELVLEDLRHQGLKISPARQGQG